MGLNDVQLVSTPSQVVPYDVAHAPLPTLRAHLQSTRAFGALLLVVPHA
jgi:hypothetical protein